MKDLGIGLFRPLSIEMFDKLFDDYFTCLCVYVEELTEAPRVVEEIVIDSFVKFWHRRWSCTSLRAVEHRLFSIATNKSFSYLKSQMDKRMTEEEWTKFVKEKTENGVLLLNRLRLLKMRESNQSN